MSKSGRTNIIIFIGPPGSGKGSISKLCEQKLQWKQVSTGDLCRKHIQEQTSIGKEIDFAIKSGKLVSDALITQMVCDWFGGNRQGASVILDGYPRTVAQAQQLHDFLHKTAESPRVIIVRFVVSSEAVVERLTTRFICKNKECQAVYSTRPGSSQAPRKESFCDLCQTELGRRSDDVVEAIRERLKVYHTHEQALLDFYKDMGHMIPEINSDQPLDLVFELIKKVAEESAA